MRNRRPVSEERVIGCYGAAVAVSVAVLFAGSAVQDLIHPAPLQEGPPFGAIDYVMVLLAAFVMVLLAGLVPFLVGQVVFRWAGIDQPFWYVVYGAALGLILSWMFNAIGVGWLMPVVAGCAGGLTYRILVGSQVEMPRSEER